MATIKRKQNGKIITKDGKVSCECCGVICSGAFETTDENVFQISKEEYDAYVSGGIWNVSVVFNFLNQGQIRYTSPPAWRYEKQYGSTTQSFTQEASGCNHSVSKILDNFTVTSEFEEIPDGPFPPPSSGSFSRPASISASIGISLKYVDKKYYIKLSGSSSARWASGIVTDGISITTKPSTCVQGRGFAPLISIDSNATESCFSFFRLVDYIIPPTTDGAFNLTATFTPNP
jgi:hypothetical protein